MNKQLKSIAWNPITQSVLLAIFIAFLTFGEYLAASDLWTNKGIELFKSLTIVMALIFAFLQIYFYTCFDSKYYNQVDYVCILLGGLSFVYAAQFPLSMYQNFLSEEHTDIPDMTHRIDLSTMRYIKTYCNSNVVTSTVNLVLESTCPMAEETKVFLKNHSLGISSVQLSSFVNGNFSKADKDLLYYQSDDEIDPPEVADFKTIFSNILLLRDLIFDSKNDESDFNSLSWANGTNDSIFKFFSSILLLNAVFLKLGLVLSKTRKRAD